MLDFKVNHIEVSFTTRYALAATYEPILTLSIQRDRKRPQDGAPHTHTPSKIYKTPKRKENDIKLIQVQRHFF